MAHPMLLEVLQSLQHLEKQRSRLVFAKSTPCSEDVKHFTTIVEWRNDIDFFPVA